jgi:hypothetical protein
VQQADTSLAELKMYLDLWSDGDDRPEF